MNPAPLDEDSLADASPEEIMSALFAGMVMQLANTALVFLGRIPHPDSNETIVDLETAKMLIDQLEMLEFKTMGNLAQDEATLLRQGLDAAKTAFVEAFNAQIDEDARPAAPSTGEGESAKKFTKKY